MSDLEQEFADAIANIGAQIQAKVKEASDALAEAVRLSDAHGVPFEADVCQIGQAYVPRSFETKYGTIDKDVAAKLTGIYKYTLDDTWGWEHSQAGC